MNPMQMLQGMRNPQQFLQQMMGNNSVMSNPTRIIQTEDFTTITAMQMADSHRKDVEHAEDM